MMTREEALSLMHEYTESESLRRHMYCIEIAMRGYAKHYGEDEEAWGLTGLLHDLDYEKYPNEEHSATEGHPSFGVKLLRERGLPDTMCEAILGHATYCGVPRESLMAKALFAVDELGGFLVACALVRPGKLDDLQIKSVKKKLKDKAFAKGVNRDDILRGAEELGVPLEEHIQFMIDTLRPHQEQFGLRLG
ncbi:MAG: HDIG domain-containing protein [Gemmatimonadetes bacterium]|nr:HDIG domain-containing protein [Gemmatimonadota bacterium]MCH8143659.1 HDIG domain-containing protein [Gemmatimonadota bacterium]MCH8934853.1 HDIG domain-containing protein [Gemmatimonadota bacterium]